MARIKIEDLPVMEELGEKQMKGIFGGLYTPATEKMKGILGGQIVPFRGDQVDISGNMQCGDGDVVSYHSSWHPTVESSSKAGVKVSVGYWLTPPTALP